MRGRCKKCATHMIGLPREAPLGVGSNTGAVLPAHEPTSLLDTPSCRQLSAEDHFRPSPSQQTTAIAILRNFDPGKSRKKTMFPKIGSMASFLSLFLEQRDPLFLVPL